MKKVIIRCLLSILNCKLLNATPCRYEFVGNIDAFSREHLQSEDAQQPGITVKEVLEQAELFKSCPISKSGFSVIEDGEFRESTVWDIQDLRNFGREKENSE